MDEDTKVWGLQASATLSASDFGLQGETVHFQVPVQMMNLERSFDIYQDQALKTSVLHLPFNSSHSMLLLLPDDMVQLENAVSPAHVSKWLKWMKPRFGKTRISCKPLTFDSGSSANVCPHICSPGNMTFIFQSSPSRLRPHWRACWLKWGWQTCLVTEQTWLVFQRDKNYLSQR